MEEKNEGFNETQTSSTERKISKKEKKRKYDDISMKPLKEDKLSNFRYSKNDNKDGVTKEKVKKKVNVKSSLVTPPPLSFNELMKMAVQKQSETTSTNSLEQELQDALKRKEEKSLEERPLSAKEKKLYEEEKMYKLKKIWKIPGAKDKKNQNTSESNISSNSNDKTENRIMKEKLTSQNNRIDKTVVAKTVPKKDSFKDSSQPSAKSYNRSKYFALHSDDKTERSKPKFSNPSTFMSNSKSNIKASNPLANSRDIPHTKTFKRIPSGNAISTLGSSSNYAAQRGYSSKPISSSSVHSSGKCIPNSLNKRKMIESDNRKMTQNRKSVESYDRKIVESEDEYDSDMDDFLDDGDEELDYSSEIAKMFKYDKSKYR